MQTVWFTGQSIYIYVYVVLLFITVSCAAWRQRTRGTLIAALIATTVLLPAAVALITVGSFLLGWSYRYAPLWGLGIGLLSWLLAAMGFEGYPRAERAIPSSFDEIKTRLSQLRVQISMAGANPAVPYSASVDAAGKEAHEQMERIEEELEQPGLPWVLATGYIRIWERLHRAEEALIEVQPSGTVIAGALYDELRLEGSNIPHCKELLRELRQAAEAIDPSARRYLKEVAATAALPLVITSPGTVTDGVVGIVWSEALVVREGKPPYNWTPSAGSLPSWLTLSAAGALSGTPPATGTFRFTARVTDSTGVTATKEFTLTVSALGITTRSPLLEGSVGVPYRQKLEVAGGTPAYKWLTGRGSLLPGGLELTLEGVLSGTPTTAGAFGFSATVADSCGQEATKEFPLIVRLASPAVQAVPATACADPKTLARAVVRTVRRMINEFRDGSFDWLVLARNRLAGTMILTGLLAYVLLAIAIIAGATQNEIAGASTFYLVGAITGLLSRLHNESKTKAVVEVEDYGLSEMRLLSMPVVSGLAAMGGVVLVAMLPLAERLFTQTPTGNLAPAPTMPSLIDIFDLSNGKNLVGLLVAAVFGLTPGLLFNRLQQQAERYTVDLKASEATQAPSRV